jgi:tripartite-type tricarboxylate transporter receptor subunit TctC
MRNWAFVAPLLNFTLTQPVFAQQGPNVYPNRPIRYIVPFPAGGSADGVARIMSRQMTQVMGQQWLVDNRPGADGVLAVGIVIKAAPDGNTVFFGSIVSTAQLKMPAKRDVAQIPYKGDAPLTADLIGGNGPAYQGTASSVDTRYPRNQHTA